MAEHSRTAIYPAARCEFLTWTRSTEESSLFAQVRRLSNRLSARKERGRRMTRRVRLSPTLRLSHSFSRGINAARKNVEVFRACGITMRARSVFTRVERKPNDSCGPRCRRNLLDRSIRRSSGETDRSFRIISPLDKCIAVGLIPCFERKNPFLFRHDSNVVIRIG